MEKFTISESPDGAFRFCLTSKTDKIILTGAGYNSREVCMTEIANVRKYSKDRQRYDKQHHLSSCKFSFNLEGTNGRIIAVSPMFDCFSDMTAGIDCVIRYGQAANVEEDMILQVC
jgi:uncharacterized protein YegP (UPF0339 family)